MPGLTTSNMFIQRDESMHCDYAGLLYRDHIVNKLTDARAHEIVEELLQIEQKFCREAVPISLIGISPQKMIQYVEWCADLVLDSFGHSKLYNHSDCGLPFMDLISIKNKSNFFETRETAYSKEQQRSTFSLEDDF